LADRESLLLASGQPFTTSVARYLDAHPEIREPLPRIYVEFLPQGTPLSFIALLDTGGHYCLLNSAVVDEIRDQLTERISSVELQTAVGKLAGDLYRHRITLIAEAGKNLDLEATLFVTADWNGPSILGYSGVLDRFRLALDPWTNRFYFGPLDDFGT
jgi:hypothetical protein